MKIAKIYGLIWLFVLAAAGALYLIGLLNEIILVIVGFIVAALTMMGLVAVIPASIHDH
jgi:hypothetical protein